MSGFMLHVWGTKGTLGKKLADARKKTEIEEDAHLPAAFDAAVKMAQRFKGEVSITVSGSGHEETERLEIHVGPA